MIAAPRVLVAVPAHDEAERILACLTSITAALGHAVDVGAISGAFVAVAAHRCADATAAVAHTWLRESGLKHLVLEVSEAATVGTVRSRLISAALACGRPTDWLFSSDADSQVPVDWVVCALGLAAATRADLLLGLVELTELDADHPVRSRHDRIVDQGIDGTGRHTHAYAANLVVRTATYLGVGGFPDLVHGEERGLADAVQAAGGTVYGSTALVVQTSGRLVGRASRGLHTVLAELAALD